MWVQDVVACLCDFVRVRACVRGWVGGWMGGCVCVRVRVCLRLVGELYHILDYTRLY